MHSATPQQYLSAFELFADGQAVLDDLTQTFGGPCFVPGQADRTAYNLGAKAVIEHIHARIAQAERPN
jgi:predicted short-subunit dehydrogenase-like oxidoreductase (DUF2520 family)